MSVAEVGSPSLVPPRPDITDSRRRLYEVAAEQFSARGFHGVSVRDLAAALDLQPASMYAHVSSKEQLLFELIRLGIVTHRDRLKAALLDAGSEPQEQVAAIVRAHVLACLEFPELTRITNRDLDVLSAEQSQAVITIRDESTRLMLDVIQRGINHGVFATDDPRLMMLTIAGMGIRAAQWWTSEDHPSAEVVADRYAEFALRLLVPHPAVSEVADQAHPRRNKQS